MKMKEKKYTQNQRIAKLEADNDINQRIIGKMYPQLKEVIKYIIEKQKEDEDSNKTDISKSSD